MTSPTIDFESIMDAFAARFVAATIGTPTGAPAMRASYAEPPKNVPATPAVVLEVRDGEVVANPGQWKHEMNVDAMFLVAKRPGDTKRVEEIRQKWLPYLLHASVDQLKLGLGGAVGYSVDKAIPTGWEWDEYDVGADTYDAIRVHWTLYVTETVSLTA